MLDLRITGFDYPPSLTAFAPLPRLVVVFALVAASAGAAETKPTLLHTPALSAKADEQVRIEGSLIGAQKIDKVVIRYRGPGESWANAPMELQYGDLFRGHIPGERVQAPGVEYYIEGVGFDRSKVPLFASPQRPHRLTVTGASKQRGRDREDPPEEEEVADEEEERPAKNPEDDPMLATDDTADEPEDDRPPKKEKKKKKKGREAAADEAFGDEPTEEPPQEDSRKKKNEERLAERPPEEKKASTKKRSEFEEELLLYGAEDTVALATRHEERVTKVPAIASSYTRAQIRALGARNVYELLDFVPGLSVSRDFQGFYRVAIRGLRAEPEVLFLLNGHRLNNFYDGRALANLPIENIERVEVIRGPGSAVYGAGAFLGVVNIVTDTDEGVRVAASGGHFEAFTGHVSAGRAVGAITVFGDADVLTQRGYKAEIIRDNLESQTIQQGFRTADDPAGTTNDRRFLVNIGAGLKWDGDKSGKFGLSLRYLNEDRAALVGLFDTVGPDSNLKWNVIMADATYERPIKDTVSLRLRGYADFHTVDRLFQLTPKRREPEGLEFRPASTTDLSVTPNPLGLRERTTFSTTTFGVDAAADATLSETNRLTVGVNLEQQSLPTFGYVTNYAVPDGRPLGTDFETPLDANGDPFKLPEDFGDGAATNRLSFGLYAQDQWTPISRLALTVGLRLDLVQLPRVTAGEVSGTAFVPSFNPRAGLVFTATEALVFKVLYQRAFRAPTVQELTENVPDASLNQGRFEGNPALRPATVDAIELGTDYIQAAGDARVRLRGNAFYENYLASIARVDETGNIVPLDNREGVRSVGVEAEGRLEASARANMFVNAAWFRAVDVETAPQSQLLTDTPQARFNVGGTLPLGEYLNLDVNLRYGVERRNNSRSGLELVRRYRIPAYTLVNAQLRTELIADRVELALLAQNVFQFEHFDDPPRPDRTPGLIPRQGFEAFGIIRGNF